MFLVLEHDDFPNSGCRFKMGSGSSSYKMRYKMGSGSSSLKL